MKNISKRIRKVTFTAAAVPIMAIIFAVSVFAAVLFRSLATGKGSISSGKTGDINMSVTATVSGQAVSSGSSSFTLKKAGDKVSFSVSLENSSEQDIIHSCELKITSLKQDGRELTADTAEYNALRSCILVYCDGVFVDSLAHIASSGTFGFVKDAPVPKGKNDSHELTFELHSAAAQYANASLEITVTDKAFNADAKQYIFVKDENEFAKAIDDINSGLLTDENGKLLTPKIIISNDVSLTANYTARNPVYIDLHGNNISGGELELCADATVISSQAIANAPTDPVKTVLNSSDAALDIYDFEKSSAYAEKVTVKAFSADKVFELVTERAKARLSNGIAGSKSVDVLTSLSFYSGSISLKVGGEGCSVAGSVVSSEARSATDVGTLTVTVGDKNEDIDFKQYGNDEKAVLEAIRTGELAHVEALLSSADAVMSDVYLPSEIKKYGASIEWISVNPDIISADGKIIDDSADREVVTLYANVRINEKVYQLTYSFTVSGVNNEVRFSNFIAQLSPLHLKEVWRGNEDTSSDDFKISHQFLPIVNTGSDFHYLKKFVSPDTTLTSAKLEWDGYQDVGFESLTYSQDATYNYVSVYTNKSGEQAVYLNTPVFSTFAQINLSAKFVGDDTVYTGAVNIIIEPGNYEELLDEVFLFVQNQLDATDIYKNVVKTRISFGMKDEKGDFVIDAKYVISSSSLSSDKYSITLDTGVSGGVITASPNVDSSGKAVSYNIAVDLTKATQVESRVPVQVTVKYTYQPEVTSTRTLYVTVPAVIRPDENGFSNYSVFSSVKYQLFGCLPAEEQTNARNAFTVSNGNVVNNTGAYILIKDIDRCVGDGGKFFEGIYAGEQLTINNGAKLDKLYFLVGKASTENAKEEKVYGLMQLIRYATGNESGTKTISVGGSEYTMPSDGKQYLTPDEIGALKSYYEGIIGSTVDFDTLFASVSYYPEANGKKSRVITDSVALGNAIKSLTNDTTVYFKYTELMRWALNEQNFPESAFFDKSYPIGNPPNGGSLSYGTRYTTTNGNSYNFVQTGNNSLKSGYFNEDDTEYISEREEVVLQAFWNGAGKLSAFKNAFAAYTVTPTYLEQDAVQVLAGEMYRALGYDGFSEKLISYDGKEVPAITSADGALEAITYFKNLTELVIKGDCTENGDRATAELPAFLHTDSLATFYNRLTSSDVAEKLEKLVLHNCAQDYVLFELDGISAFSSLKYLDLGMNYGLKTLGAALDITSSDIVYLDLSGADSADKYSRYSLAVLSGRVSELYHTPDSGRGGKTAEKIKFTVTSIDKSLAYLRELEKIDGQYVQLQQGITLTTSTAKARIYWQIDTGNPIYQSPVTKAGEFTAGTFGSYSTPAGMISELTNWYYCTADMTVNGTVLNAGYLYPVKFADGKFMFDTENKRQIQRVTEAPELTEEEKNEVLQGVNIAYKLDVKATGDNSSTPEVIGQEDLFNGSTQYYLSTDGTRRLNTTQYRRLYWRKEKITYNYSFTYTGSKSGLREAISFLSASGAVIRYEYTVKQEGVLEGTVVVETTKTNYYAANGTTNTLLSLGNADMIYWGTWRQVGFTVVSSASVDKTVSNTAEYKYGSETFTIENYTGDQTADGVKNNFPSEWFSEMQNSIDWYDPEVLTNSSTVTMSVREIGTEAEASAAISRLENIANGVQQFDGGYSVFLYTGTSGSGTYYSGGNATNYTFTANRFYRLVWENGALTWSDTQISKASATDSTVTMELILAEANTDANSVKRGNWLGLYVWYSGTGDNVDRLTVNGRTYEKGYVYRIVWADETHTKFTYDRYRTCESVNDGEFASKPLNATEEGAIYYLTKGTNFYSENKFYVMTYDNVGGFWYLNRFGDSTPLLNISENGDEHSFMRIKNEKLYITTGSDYSGTGGTEYVDISAVVIINGSEYKRTFRVEVIG